MNPATPGGVFPAVKEILEEFGTNEFAALKKKGREIYDPSNRKKDFERLQEELQTISVKS